MLWAMIVIDILLIMLSVIFGVFTYYEIRFHRAVCRVIDSIDEILGDMYKSVDKIEMDDKGKENQDA